MSPMYSELVDALLAMGEYTGTEDAFLGESATTIQRVLKCSAEHADDVLRNLLAHNAVAFELAVEEGLLRLQNGIPVASWIWYTPSAA